MATAVYTVTGMTCDHCASAVSTAVHKLTDMRKVAVDLAHGTVLVTSDGPLDSEAVRRAVDDAGYELVHVEGPM
jgi:copper chaperone CopZ